MAMCPRHLIKTIKRVKIVKWESIFKIIRFKKSISFKNAFHLTIFTRLMVFTICPGQITIVKWNFQHNDNLPFAWFSQHLGIVKWIFRNCVREETSFFSGATVCPDFVVILQHSSANRASWIAWTWCRTICRNHATAFLDWMVGLRARHKNHYPVNWVGSGIPKVRRR